MIPRRKKPRPSFSGVRGFFVSAPCTLSLGNTDEAAGRFNARRVAAQFTPRTLKELAAFFDGLDFVDPGLVPLPEWRAVPEPGQVVVAAVGGTGKKP